MNTRTLLTVALLTTAAAGRAQTAIPAPEFKNKVYYVKKDNTLADLDNTDMQSEMKNSMTTARINLRASGTAASIKHSGLTSCRFIVKIEDGVDPETAVELFKFDVDKKGRLITVGTVSMGQTKNATLPRQPLTFVKQDNGAYLVTTKADLAPGEYGFIVNRPSVGIGGSANVKANAFEVAAE